MIDFEPCTAAQRAACANLYGMPCPGCTGQRAGIHEAPAAAIPGPPPAGGTVTAKVPAIGAPVFVALGVGLHAGTVAGWRVQADEGHAGATVTVKVAWIDEDGTEAMCTVHAAAVFSSAEAAALAMWGRA